MPGQIFIQRELPLETCPAEGLPKVIVGSDERSWVFKTVLRHSTLSGAGAGAAAASVDESIPSTNPVVYRALMLGCAGENNNEQKHVGAAIQVYQRTGQAHQLHLLGDMIYPGGVGDDTDKAATEVDTYLMQIYGEQSSYQVAAVLGNHEQECYRGVDRPPVVGGPLIERAKQKGQYFVDALQVAERKRQGADPQAIPNYFMPHRYYCQLIFTYEGIREKPVAIVLHLDSSSLPADKEQQTWLGQLNEYLQTHYPDCLHRLIIMHHSVDFTVGKRGLKKDERAKQSLGRNPKYPAGEDSYPGNHHQQVGRALRTCGLTLPQWTVFAAHEHTFSVLETGYLDGEPALQIVVGTGGGRDNKQDYKTLAPGLRHTETGFGYAELECYADGSKQVRYYDLPNAKRSSGLRARYGRKPCFTGRYAADGRPLGNPQGLTYIHPRLLVQQYEWFEVLFEALKSGNLSVCRLVLAVYTDCLHDMEKAQFASDDNKATAKSAVRTLFFPGESHSYEVPSLSLGSLGDFLKDIESVIYCYRDSQFTPSFNQLSAMHFLLRQVYIRVVNSTPLPVIASYGSETGAAASAWIEPSVSSGDIEAGVIAVCKRALQEGERPADGGLNPRYAQKKFLLTDETSASAEQDEADFVMERASRRLPSLDEPDLTSPIARSPLPEPDGLTVTSPIARSPRGRRPDIMAPLLEGIVVDSGSSILEDEGQLRCCLLRTFIDFARIVVKGRLEESLEYATEEASYRSLAPALLVAGLVMMMHPQAVVASILAQPRPLVIKSLLLGVLGSEQADLVDARTYRPSVDLQAFIDAKNSLVGLLLPDKVHRVLQHSELWCRLYQVAGNTRRVETIRITGIFQRIDRLLESRSGYGYAVSNTLASWKLGGCRRPTAWLSYDQAQELWGDFCGKFIRADTTESLKTSLTIEVESYFQQADGAFIVKPEYDADPILQQIVRAISLLPEEPVVFEGVRSTLQEDGWLGSDTTVVGSLVS